MSWDDKPINSSQMGRELQARRTRVLFHCRACGQPGYGLRIRRYCGVRCRRNVGMKRWRRSCNHRYTVTTVTPGALPE
jgi:hypothetical protein